MMRICSIYDFVGPRTLINKEESRPLFRAFFCMFQVEFTNLIMKHTLETQTLFIYVCVCKVVLNVKC